MSNYRNRIFVVSNMYPSSTHKSYGIFIQKFEKAIEQTGYLISCQSVIRGKGRNSFSKTVKYIAFYISIVSNLLRRNYDILYVHYISNSAPLLFLFWWLIKKKLVVNFHGGDLLQVEGLEKYTRYFTKYVVERGNLIVVPSAYFGEEVVSRFNVKRELIHIYPSGGVDLSIFKPIDSSKQKDEMQLEGFFIIGLVARIDKGKRWDVFLESIYAFHEENPLIRCKAVVVGNGLEIGSFHSKIEQLGLGNIVVFLGEKDHTELPTIYNMMDIFIFATDNESLGLVGLEAMACGVPIMAPLVGGIKSYLQDEINGFSLESLNTKALVDKMKLFYELNTHDKERMRESAILTAKKFDRKKVTEDLATRLRTLQPAFS